MTRLTAVRRNLAALAVAPLLLTGLAACGDGGETTAKDPAAESLAGAAVLTGLKTGDEVDPDEFIGIVVDGMEASTTAHMTMTTTMGQLGEMTAEGDVDYTADPVAMAMTLAMPTSMPMGDQPADLRFVDGVFYMSMGELTGGKFWKLDPADSSSPLGDLGPMLDQMDPTAMMQRLEPAIDSVTYAGEEDVDGRSLDHYELTVDAAALGKAMNAPKGALGQLPDSVSYDLWLDEEHRMVQTTMELPIQGMTASVEMTVEDWGKDVSIEAPPAGQITDMPDLGAMTHPSPTV
ncbi:LppX_LprAFG lipoprotein [Nocardioides sp. T2.26MG-1]|uniref:LppX_LprAFG lipoprotein n=1 Tax=Nocardioides sp. T2.26MG-1 TaxID=3041166 RepID=UPI00247784F1|nr:LppX_LprAFG lipoprotein [Nocardioides sp. T2.26MG-1]CAI9419231.1 hypothetical protein HIDPHFAB_03589 [Nocardioides sp. T2.26MG-1]